MSSLAAGAEEAKDARFYLAVDPPWARVFAAKTVLSPTTPEQERGFGEEQKPNTELTFRMKTNDERQFLITAPGYKEEEIEIQYNGKDGVQRREIRLDPITLQAKLVDAVWHHPFFSLFFVAASLAGLTKFARRKLDGLADDRLARRIQALGGDPVINKVGEFYLVKKIGEGGYGQVFKAVHRSELLSQNPEFVALKMMTNANLEASVGGDEDTKQHQETLKERFRREALAMNRMQHDNIVRSVHYDLEHPQSPYIAMEFVQGETLTTVMSRHQKGMSVRQALAYLRPLCEALQYAHSQNPPVIHRDLKPDNIMVTSDGILKVMDFGLAYTLGDKNLTRSQDWVGTPAYANPDGFMRRLSPAMDQHSVGLIAFQLLTGTNPNAGDTPHDCIGRCLSGNLERLHDYRPDLSELSEVLQRMTSLEPQARYHSIADALRHFEEAAARLPADVQQKTP